MRRARTVATAHADAARRSPTTSTMRTRQTAAGLARRTHGQLAMEAVRSPSAGRCAARGRRRRQTRRVEHAAPVDDDARAAEVRGVSARYPRGRPGRSRRRSRSSRPTAVARRAQLRRRYSGSPASGRAPRARSSSRSAAAPENAISLTPPRYATPRMSTVWPSSEPPRALGEQLDGVGGHRVVDLASDARQPRVGSPSRGSAGRRGCSARRPRARAGGCGCKAGCSRPR